MHEGGFLKYIVKTVPSKPASMLKVVRMRPEYGGYTAEDVRKMSFADYYRVMVWYFVNLYFVNHPEERPAADPA